MSERPKASNASPPAACLLVVPPGCDAPLDLVNGLARRHLGLREVNDAASAMCSLAREAQQVLIVIEPAMLIDADALAAAVRRYHPTVALWEYRTGHQPPLRHWAQPDTGQTDASPADSQPTGTSSAESSPSSEPSQPAAAGSGHDAAVESSDRWAAPPPVAVEPAPAPQSPPETQAEPQTEVPPNPPVDVTSPLHDEIAPTLSREFDADQSAASLLSDEELAMLLDEESSVDEGARRP